MRAYILNLDRAQNRWAFVEQAFAGTKFEVQRITAIDGQQIQFPIKEYAEGLYLWFHGRPTSIGHVGCYLSHVKALETFLATEDEHALIGEDDLTLQPDFESALESAMKHSKHWDVLRLTGLSNGQPHQVTDLGGGYSLQVSMGRLKGTGAYVVNRKAAKAWVKGLLPMRLPIDHAVDREWVQGLRAAYIQPFPASQTESGFRSSIQVGKSLKMPKWKRYIAAYPYQAFNEISRWLFRGLSLFRMRQAIRSSAAKTTTEKA
jgi:glycosyl transferase, family 25